ncbi:helix-turn-helix transcriptional regulator [Neobacillus mesonae]|uniref:helix-turn-helix domain-containing protein n=1 Tax=Neobacillus mesonae TaxID=1193713 RepID=UPI00203E74BE|nr:helix-turn-helix transcriptional regulator [Neobacillus mesonae]MCM3567832.1 helix-turn-helix domain-containing protein [Neobacillus mesonae]
MIRINNARLKRLREKMYLTESYVAGLLNCPIERYQLIEGGRLTVTDEELQTLSLLFGINEQHLITEEIKSTEILARTHKELTENDERQIAEFLNFQKMLKKNIKKELSVR